MVDHTFMYNGFNISIETVIKNPEMLKFIYDHLKTKQMCNYAVEKLPFMIRYVPDRYKTKKKCVIRLFQIIMEC